MSTPILKLDEIVGRSNPLKVERLGKTFELIRPEGLTLKQNAEWQAMGKKILQAFGPLAKKNNQGRPASAEETGKAVDDCLKLICPEILLEEKPYSVIERMKRKIDPSNYQDRQPFSFEEKLKVLEFYIAEALSGKTSKKTDGRNRHHPNSTGA